MDLMLLITAGANDPAFLGLTVGQLAQIGINITLFFMLLCLFGAVLIGPVTKMIPNLNKYITYAASFVLALIPAVISYISIKGMNFTPFLILLGVCILLAIVLNVVSEGTSAIVGLIGLVVMGVVAFVAWNMADPTVPAWVKPDAGVNASSMKLIDMTLVLFWILFAVASVLFLLSLIRDLISGFFN